MEDEATTIERLFEDAKQYSKTSAELFKLKTINNAADIASSFTSIFIIIFILVLAFFIASIGASLWLGEIFGKIYYGFYAISILVVFIAFILYIVRHKWIKKYINNLIIKNAIK